MRLHQKNSPRQPYIFYKFGLQTISNYNQYDTVSSENISFIANLSGFSLPSGKH